MQIKVQVRDNRLRSIPPLRKLGCDMELAAHRATGALGRLCGGLARISRAAAVAIFGGSHGRNGTYCRPSLTSQPRSGWQNISSHATPTLRSNCFVLPQNYSQPTSALRSRKLNSNLPDRPQTKFCFRTSGDSPYSQGTAPTAVTLTQSSEHPRRPLFATPVATNTTPSQNGQRHGQALHHTQRVVVF